MKNSGSQKYELMVIIDSSNGEDATKKRLEKIKKQISAQKGEIFFEDLWGEKRLGYPMKGKTDGYYAVFNFTLEGGDLKEIDTALRLEPEVIRHLVVKLPFAFEPKSLEDYAKEKEAADAAKEAEKTEKTSQ